MVGGAGEGGDADREQDELAQGRPEGLTAERGAREQGDDPVGQRQAGGYGQDTADEPCGSEHRAYFGGGSVRHG